MSNRPVVISGCSGGGKSTLLSELSARGHRVVEEPGRRIVKQEIATGGRAFPWVDPVAFTRRAIEVALADLEASRTYPGVVFFDRGLVDAASGLEALTGEPALATYCSTHRYHSTIFRAPPWRGIYAEDEERKHGFEEGLAEYQRLAQVFPAPGYAVFELPKTSVVSRADFVLASLASG